MRVDLLWECLWVGILFGSMLYNHKLLFASCLLFKSFLSHLQRESRSGTEVEVSWPSAVGHKFDAQIWHGEQSACTCGSPLIETMTRAVEQSKSLSKIAWDKDLENLLFISLRSPWRLLLREEMQLPRLSRLFFPLFTPRLQRQSAESFLGMLHLFRANVALREGAFSSSKAPEVCTWISLRVW